MSDNFDYVKTKWTEKNKIAKQLVGFEPTICTDFSLLASLHSLSYCFAI